MTNKAFRLFPWELRVFVPSRWIDIPISKDTRSSNLWVKVVWE
jgi:hypothetical protein